ncbi:UDP-N-acetylmuramoyl-L-alanyl-D-glutamate--2,6-diaminopimelate ligase [Peptococcaceae bacterium 1198_IL3148]
MNIELDSIIKNLEVTDIRGSTKINIEGIAYNSNSVRNNYLFVAVEGFKVDGHRFINDAISKGAKTIVISKDINVAEGITIIKVKDTRAALSALAASFYGYPSQDLELIGITGTNGKTTTAYFTKSILDSDKRKNSLISTVEIIINGNSHTTTHTTPESLELQKMFKSMIQQGVTDCVMEVSSHSIQLSRVHDCDFNIAIFTNLTHEHLDFHGNMENYYNAKKQLFHKANNFNIVNIDDPFGDRLAKEIANNKAKLLTYGINHHADITAKDITINEKYSAFTINTPEEKINVQIKIPGMYNIYNSLAAATCGYALGIDLAHIKAGLEAVSAVPGRFEVIRSDKNRTVIIDYAHTPDGFEKLLGTISKFAKGRKIIVFGCVGERDHTKRCKMGEIAERYCDLCVLTTDNCRSEQPRDIINEIKKGFKKANSYIEILDRAEAIRHAILTSKENDTIIITGKGHEKCQIIGSDVMYFNEREIVTKALDELPESFYIPSPDMVWNYAWPHR